MDICLQLGAKNILQACGITGHGKANWRDNLRDDITQITLIDAGYQ